MSGRVPLSSLTPAPTEDLDAPPRADTALDTASLPTADDILGPPPKSSAWDVQPAALGAGSTAQAAETNAPAPGATPLPTADDILGPPPGAERESAKRVLAAFGHGFGETMAGGPAFTLEDPVTQESLKAVGLLPDLKKGQDGLLAAFGQQILLPAVKAAGWAATGISAGISGLQAAVEQKGIELGMPQLGRELAALPEAFPQEFGGAQGVLVRGYRPPIPPVVQQASDLGVIGAGDLGWKGYEAIPKPGDEVAATQARIQVAREVANENRQAAMPYAYGPTAETPAAPFQPYGAQIEQVTTDVHQAARQAAPETFREYDGLYQQRDELRSQIAASQQELQERAAAQAPGAAEIADLERRLEDTTPRLAKKYEARLAELRPVHDAFLADEFTMGALIRDTPEIESMRQDLQAVDYRMRDLAPDVTAAYREAEKQFPTETQAAGTTPERGAVETTGAIPSATTATPAPRTVAEYVDDYIAGKGRDSPAHEQFAANNAPAIEAEFQRRAALSGTAPPVTAELRAVPPPLKATAGWKLHINIEPGSKLANDVEAEARQLGAVDVKQGLSGGQTGKGMTIYVGARNRAAAIARELSGKFKLPAATGDALVDDMHMAPGVMGRFDANGDADFHQYGKGGVPILKDLIQYGEPFSDEAIATSHRELTRRYGGFYTGTERPAAVPTTTAPISRFLGADWLREAGERDGAYDMGRGGTALAAEAERALKAGHTVELVADGGRKVVPIVAVDRGLLRDAAGQRWGSLSIATDATGTEGLRITPKATRAEAIDIAADVAQRFAAAGRPAEEADALGTLAAHYYDARAARLGSTAADLYQQEPLTIRSKASGGPKGQAAGKAFIEGGRSIITLFTGRADASTAIHELGHAWLEDLLKDASNPAATDATRADAAATRGWLNAEPTADITTRQHEKFARAFERYMYEGQAPSTGLRGVFEQFAGWLRDVYATIRDAGKPISDDIRDVFDRFLAREPEERAVIAPEVPLEKPPMPRGPAQIMAEEAAAGRKIGEKRAKAMSDAEFGRYADWQEANRRKKPEAAAPAPVATPPPTAAVVAEAVRNEPVERLSNEVGVDPAGLTVSEFYGAIAQKIDAAEEATRLESEHAAEFMETDDAVHDWATHTGLVYADFTPHITELEAEDAYRQAAAAPAAPDRAELGERPAPATGSEGEGESGGGMGGRGAASGRRGASGGGQPGRGGTGDIADKAGNIRLDNLGGTEAMNAAIREIVAANGDYLDRRYGDAAYSAEKEVWATRELERQAAFDYAEKGRKGAASGSPADVAAYLEARERLNMVSGRLSELTASAGRTLRAFRAMPEFAAGEDIAAFAQRVAGKTLYQIQEEMRLAGTLNEWSGPQFARSMSESTWARTRSIMIAYYINALISGPITHAAYMVGNTNFALFKALGETSIQATIGAAREAIAGEPVERVHFQEASAQLYGMMRGLRDGISPAVQALKTGVPVMKGLAADELGLGAMGARPQVIPGLAGRILETPSRAVAAIHTLFYSMGYEQEIARLAVRDAFANSLVPGTSEFDTHIARYTMQPRVEDIEAAHNEALGMVLMKRPAYGSAQYHLVAAINKDPTGLSKVVMPFMQIGMNILEKGIVEETPLAYLQKASRDDLLGRNGQIRRDIRAGKIIAGSMLGLTTVGLAMEGLITGGGPSDPKQRAIWMAAGNRPYSVSIGGVNLPYRKLLGPLGPLMGATADIYEVGHALDEKGLSEAAASAAFGFSEVVADESWMSGLSNFVEAVKGGPKAASYIRNSLMAWMPFSSGMRQTARLVDPYQRRVTDLVDAARNMVPGLSMQDYPQRDVWGEPIVSTQMALPSIARPDPVAAKMDELGLSVSRLNPEVRGVRLSPQQYDDYSRIAGKLSRMLLSGGVTTPGFSALPPETQKAWVTRQVDVAREQARQNVMAMYPDIMRQAAENKARQVRVR